MSHFIRNRKATRVGGAAVLAGLLLAAFSGASQASAHPARAAAAKKVVISTRKVPRLGQVLVDSKGLTLYMFVPDKRRRVTCVSTCAVVWPPVFLPKGGKAVASRLAHQKLLGSDKDPAGGRVVTYHGWPLYTYVADTKPGMATGQALNLNGGLWYVVAPSGKVIKQKAT
jgi:predicted lipoprotein with Yx(FWY)xxD motif